MRRLARRPIVFVGVPAAVLILAAFFAIPACGCSSELGAMKAETELIQSAMYAMMAENGLARLTANDNSNNSLGVKTWTALPEGKDAVPLVNYRSVDMYGQVKDTTKFYYCWDSQGNVWAQNETDAVMATAEGAKIQRPCKKAPRDPMPR